MILIEELLYFFLFFFKLFDFFTKLEVVFYVDFLNFFYRFFVAERTSSHAGFEVINSAQLKVSPVIFSLKYFSLSKKVTKNNLKENS